MQQGKALTNNSIHTKLKTQQLALSIMLVSKNFMYRYLYYLCFMYYMIASYSQSFHQTLIYGILSVRSMNNSASLAKLIKSIMY